MTGASAEARLLAQRLAKVPDELQKGLRPALRKGAEPIMAAAKANASWSSRIPGAIRLSTSFGQKNPGVTIRASARIAPHARPYEGAGGRGGTFRHPVYGDRDAWVTQATRPFLFPAVRAGRQGVIGELEHAVDDALARHGF